MRKSKLSLQLCFGLVSDTVPHGLCALPARCIYLERNCLPHCPGDAEPVTESEDKYDSLTLGQKIMYVSVAVLFKPGFGVQVRNFAAVS